MAFLVDSTERSYQQPVFGIWCERTQAHIHTQRDTLLESNCVHSIAVRGLLISCRSTNANVVDDCDYDYVVAVRPHRNRNSARAIDLCFTNLTILVECFFFFSSFFSFAFQRETRKRNTIMIKLNFRLSFCNHPRLTDSHSFFFLPHSDYGV